jgi:UDP-3-O-[3-hydroxymyristoyl] glucosamine N-acyltransferase
VGKSSKGVIIMLERKITIQEIADILNLQFFGENIDIDGLNLCNRSSEYKNLLSYITSIKYSKYLHSKIKALFIDENTYAIISKEHPDIVYFVVDAPEEYFYKLHAYLYDNTSFYDHKNFAPIIGDSCSIHPTAQIENGVIIGNNVKIGYYSVIKSGSIIADNVTIGCGSIIGAEEFQALKDKSGNNYLVAHTGGCKLCENVFVGDNVIVCKSLFEGQTIVGKNTKIDHFVNISHNCIIGSNCVLTVGVILAGSTTLEDDVWIAPNATIMNKAVLGKGSFIGIGSVVVGKVKAGKKVFGNPAIDIVE